MTALEFKAARKALQLTINGLAEQLRINERTVRRWEKGTIPVPHPVALAMQYLATL